MPKKRDDTLAMAMVSTLGLGRGEFDYALIAEKSSRNLFRVKCDANKRLIMKSIVHFGLFPNQINSEKKRNS